MPNSNHALKDRITQVNVQGNILQITINTFPAEADDLQQIHDNLAVALEACGIKELNMHVIQQKLDIKKNQVAVDISMLKVKDVQTKQRGCTEKQFTPVIDASGSAAQAAAQPVETDPNNPPIQKQRHNNVMCRSIRVFKM